MNEIIHLPVDYNERYQQLLNEQIEEKTKGQQTINLILLIVALTFFAAAPALIIAAWQWAL